MSPEQLQQMSPTDSTPTKTSGRRPARSWRRLSVLAAFLGIVAYTLSPSGPAVAVHDLGLFELDGNVADGVALGDDWAALFPTDPAPPAGAKVKIFTADTADTGELTGFLGGGSKDVNDINQWGQGVSDVPDKNDITNAYAAAYTSGTGDLVLYFGADLFDSGEGNLGFWFFKNEIVPSGAGFSGVHQVGDILVDVDFTQGGTIGTIDVLEWNPSGGPPGNLDLLMSGAACDPLVTNDLVCGRVNTDDSITPPWPYTSKANGNAYPVNAFFEAGINLTDILSPLGVQPCFASFMAKTRTSQSDNALLTDFVLSGFDICALTVEKTGDAQAKIGDEVTYTVTITNNGLVELFKDDVEDSLLAADGLDPLVTDGVNDTSDHVVSNDCGESLLPGGSCTIVYTREVQPDDPDLLVNTVTVAYNSGPGSEFDGIEVTDDGETTTDLFQPGVEVLKTVSPELSKVGDTVTYTFTINNLSSSDSPDLLVDSIDDELLGGDLLEFAPPACDLLIVDGTCSFDVEYTIQADDPDPLPNTVFVHYHPRGFENPITDDATARVDLFQPSIVVDKTGPESSKIGDTVTYTINVTNTSSADTPTLVMDSITDSLVPNLTIPAGCNSLAPGASCQFNVDRVVQAGDPDPLDNTATAHYHPEGFTNDISEDDTHRVNLFQPGIEVEKSGPDSANLGENVTYTITVTNTSSDDAPALVLDSITDSLIGELTIPAECNQLASGESCEFTADRTVLAGDPDPLVNTATVHYHPEGFENDITDTDDHSLTVLAEGRIIIKKVADEYDANEAFPFSADFDGNADDGSDFSLEAGEQQEFVLLAGTYSVKELVPAGWKLVNAVCSDQSPVTAIVLAPEETVTCTFTNEKNDYDQYPGDDDFIFDTPFVDPDPAPADPDPGTIIAGNQVPAVQPAPQTVSPETASQPDPVVPVALDQLPRTGQGLDRITMLGGMMLLLGGLTVMVSRRRKAHKA